MRPLAKISSFSCSLRKKWSNSRLAPPLTLGVGATSGKSYTQCTLLTFLPNFLGPPGNPAPATPDAQAGAPGIFNMYESDMKFIGDHISSELVQMALREANKYYRISEFAAARDIYVWMTLALENSTDPERKGYAHKAAVMLIQMSKGTYHCFLLNACTRLRSVHTYH